MLWIAYIKANVELSMQALKSGLFESTVVQIVFG